MVLMSSTDHTLNEQQRAVLLQTARESIRTGLREGHPLVVNPADFEEALQAERATFVTLNEDGKLRGCIGHLEAIQPLIRDVADNAFSAAFQDSHFPPVSEREFDRLEIHISVLSPPQPSFLRFRRRPFAPDPSWRGWSYLAGWLLPRHLPAIGMGAVAQAGRISRPPETQGRSAGKIKYYPQSG